MPNTYPEEITAAVLEKSAHLSVSEIERDIRETEQEIAAYEKSAEGLSLIAELPGDVPDRQMARLKASHYRDTNRDRRAFVAFLRKLLAARRRLTPIALALGDPTGRTVGL